MSQPDYREIVDDILAGSQFNTHYRSPTDMRQPDDAGIQFNDDRIQNIKISESFVDSLLGGKPSQEEVKQESEKEFVSEIYLVYKTNKGNEKVTELPVTKPIMEALNLLKNVKKEVEETTSVGSIGVNMAPKKKQKPKTLSKALDMASKFQKEK